MDKPWKVIFAFVGVFIAGAVFGGLFTLRAGGRRLGNLPVPVRSQMQEPMPGSGQGSGQRLGPGQGQGPMAFQGAIGPAMLRQLNQRLKLTDEQREKIRPVVTRAAEEMQRLSRENLQNTTRIVERMHLDIAGWLTPEQRDALEDMKTQMRARVGRAAMENRGGEFSGRGDGSPMQRKNQPGPNQSRPNPPNPNPSPSQPPGIEPPPGQPPGSP
jgi:Spy/CpxP family protein refolding chaperone